MKKAILSLFIAFSLLLAPIAHAAEMSCQGGECTMSEQVKKQSDTDTQDNGKVANSDHYCCCHHVSVMPNFTLAAPMTVSSRTVFVLEQDATTSVVVGPPLKPPSHA